MIAIKPSWTRSPQPFAIRVKPSAFHKAAFFTFAAAVAALLLFSPLSLFAKLTCIALMIAYAWSEWQQLRSTPLQVLCCSPAGTWSVYNGVDSFSGQLSNHTYRSRWLSIVAIKNVRRDIRYVIVFYDSVECRSYSLLQMHLKFPI